MTKEPTGNAIPPTKPFCSYKEQGSGRRGKWNPIVPSCKDASVTREGTPTVRLRSSTVTSVLDLCMCVMLSLVGQVEQDPSPQRTTALSGYLVWTEKYWMWTWAPVPSSQQVQNQCKHIFHLYSILSCFCVYHCVKNIPSCDLVQTPNLGFFSRWLLWVTFLAFPYCSCTVSSFWVDLGWLRSLVSHTERNRTEK